MKSYWIDSEKEKKKYKELKEDIETDICIIGGGITGVSVSYYLNKYKIKNVTIIPNNNDCVFHSIFLLLTY